MSFWTFTPYSKGEYKAAQSVATLGKKLWKSVQANPERYYRSAETLRQLGNENYVSAGYNAYRAFRARPYYPRKYRTAQLWKYRRIRPSRSYQRRAYHRRYWQKRYKRKRLPYWLWLKKKNRSKYHNSRHTWHIRY